MAAARTKASVRCCTAYHLVMTENYDHGHERVIVLNSEKDHAGVYHDELHGNYGTFMIFDGSLADCLAWVELWQQWPRSEEQEQRFKQLCLSSAACPAYHQQDYEDWEDEDVALYPAFR